MSWHLDTKDGEEQQDLQPTQKYRKNWIVFAKKVIICIVLIFKMIFM